MQSVSPALIKALLRHGLFPDVPPKNGVKNGVRFTSSNSSEVNLTPFAVVGFGAAFSSYGVAWALTAKITIYMDRFEQTKPFIHRVLPVAAIDGRRYTKGPGAGYPMIVPKVGSPFSIDAVSYGLDRRFDRWFLRLRDLD